jgi:hypothetical protein
VLTDLQLSNSGNVEEVSALALGFVVFATFWKRISTFRTLAANSPRALRLSGRLSMADRAYRPRILAEAAC